MKNEQGTPLTPTTPTAPTNKPQTREHRLRENPMLGGTEEATAGVLEFENLTAALESHLATIEDLQTFETSKEWLAWKEMESQPASEAREQARLAVLAKLEQMDILLDEQNKREKKLINLFMNEVESKA